MPLYRLSVRVISRGNTARLTARNVVAASAYNAREAIYDERQEYLHNYEHRSADLIHSEVLLPADAPERWLDRATLWNEVEAGEVRRDARLARSLILTLPRELSQEVNVDLARGYLRRTFVDRGMIADMAVHEKSASDGEPQPHAHALLTLRRIVDGAFSLKERAWNSVQLLRQWREEWADVANRKLAEHGISGRLDHRRWFVMPDMTKVQDAARLAGAFAMIGAAVTTQAMRDTARRLVRLEKTAEVSADPPRAPIEVLREELRRPLRLAAVGVAAGDWSYEKTSDKLIADHLLPAIRKFPELDARFEELEEKIRDALAKGVERVQAQIAGNADVLRARSRERERVMSGAVGSQRDDAAYVAQVADRLGVPRAAEVDRLMTTPEVRAMEAHVQDRISASATGEVGRLSVDRAPTTQAQRDRARQAVPAQAQAAASADMQAQQAARRAQAAAERSHELTLG